MRGKRYYCGGLVAMHDQLLYPGWGKLMQALHYDWGETRDRQILQKCYEALPKGGAVIISELLVNEGKDHAPSPYQTRRSP